MIRVPEEDMDDYRGMLADLLELKEGLTEWEADFIASLKGWAGAFTEKQAETLQKIYDRRL